MIDLCSRPSARCIEHRLHRWPLVVFLVVAGVLPALACGGGGGPEVGGDDSPPGVPQNLTARWTGSDQIDLSWDASTDDSGQPPSYQVMLADGTAVGQVQETTFVHLGVQPRIEHCYAVQAFDAAGNRSAASTQACAAPDLSPPTVVSTSPAAGETGVPMDVAITATFDEPIDPGSLSSEQFVLRTDDDQPIPGGRGGGIVQIDGATATLTPDGGLDYGNSYLVILFGARDLQGNSMEGEHRWFFSTGYGTWRPTSIVDTPWERAYHTALWTGTQMLLWGGWGNGPEVEYPPTTDTGGLYDPVTDAWTPTSLAGAPAPRSGHVALWTGSEMLVWGGWGDVAGQLPEPNGARFDPETDTWAPLSGQGAPPDGGYAGVWTGSEMILWGCVMDPFEGTLPSGGRYHLASNTWAPISGNGAPSARCYASVVWTGSEVLVWGGMAQDTRFNDGGLYDPVTDSWRPITNLGAPSPRTAAVSVWSAAELIVWGGYGGGDPMSEGGRYDPVGDRWTPISTVNEPPVRSSATAIWTGTEMLVWGGQVSDTYLRASGRYNPSTDTWTPMSTLDAPLPRASHAAVWTGTEMIVWGGNGGPSYANGGRYRP